MTSAGALALLTLAVSAGEATAGDPSADKREPEAAAPGAPPLTPGIVTLLTLARKGLLQSVFSNEAYGITQNRMGEFRQAMGFGRTIGVTKGYEYHDTAYLAALNLVKELPMASGASFVRLTGAATLFDAEKTQIWNSGESGRVELQYLYAPQPTRVFGLGLVYENAPFDNHFEIVGQDGTIAREGWGFRADYAEQIHENWGLSGRVEYTMGETITKSPSIGYKKVQSDDRLYGQMELIGTFTQADWDGIPAWLVVHPVLGASYGKWFLGESTDSFGITSAGVVDGAENYGTSWARVNFEKAPQMTPDLQVLPNLSLGIEHAFDTNIDMMIDEPNYAVLSAGVGLLKANHRVDIGWGRREGLRGVYSNQVIYAGWSIAF